jgi:hypothetical protein
MEASTIESNLTSSFSYQSIKTIFKISCIDLRTNVKTNLIKLNHVLENLFSEIEIAFNIDNFNDDTKIKIRKVFVQNSENSKLCPSINELKNLWNILLDWKEEISDKIYKKKFLVSQPKFCNKNLEFYNLTKNLVSKLRNYEIIELNVMESVKECLQETKSK